MPQPQSGKSISEVLSMLNRNEDNEVALITANAINVYLDAIKRLEGRVKLIPQDIENLMGILSLLIGDRMRPQTPVEEAVREAAQTGDGRGI